MFLKMCYGLDMKCLTQDHDLSPGFLVYAIWRISSNFGRGFVTWPSFSPLHQSLPCAQPVLLLLTMPVHSPSTEWASLPLSLSRGQGSTCWVLVDGALHPGPTLESRMKWVEVHSHNTPGPQRLFILHWLIDKLFLFIHLLKKYWGGGHWGDSVGQSNCHQTWWLERDSQLPHGRRKETTCTLYPLTSTVGHSTRMHKYTCMSTYTHAYIHNL